ncbi:S41 family peptidase [Nocardiopsis exhalans]|uniref:S41 family peptidase n=1 Tax=Nocardiopsis exhalans TaxID=163604 RepID=A0ABY5D4N5_9ACTN|nr:S41 family peptidase [Nocardiopsis exhalans]USY19337.1 S41 family peptidase [Nocardiopsis exhalans]
MNIDALVEETGRLVAGHYVFPETGERLRLLLAERHAAGGYRGAGDPAALAELVTGDLQSLNGDLHLRLKHHVEEIPALPGDSGLMEVMAREARERFGGEKPLAVLTSATTFSGAEELAYDLQRHGRATVVGERTGGGAHPGRVSGSTRIWR